jgi:hypothetical protein
MKVGKRPREVNGRKNPDEKRVLEKLARETSQPNNQGTMEHARLGKLRRMINTDRHGIQSDLVAKQNSFFTHRKNRRGGGSFDHVQRLMAAALAIIPGVVGLIVLLSFSDV